MSKGKVSAEDKIYAVNLYLDGRKSQRQIAAAYGVKPSSVNQWIRNYQSMGADAFTLKENKKYNGHEELKSSGTGGSTIMTKGRKTTFDERVEIVQYCIEHDHKYIQLLCQN